MTDKYKLTTEISQDGRGTYTPRLKLNGKATPHGIPEPMTAMGDEIYLSHMKHLANSGGKIRKWRLRFL